VKPRGNHYKAMDGGEKYAETDRGFHIVMGILEMDGLHTENPNLKWMIWSTPILGNLQMKSQQFNGWLWRICREPLVFTLNIDVSCRFSLLQQSIK